MITDILLAWGMFDTYNMILKYKQIYLSSDRCDTDLEQYNCGSYEMRHLFTNGIADINSQRKFISQRVANIHEIKR